MVKIVRVDEEMRVSHTWRITSWSASRGFVLVLMVDGSGRRDGLPEALMMTNSHGNRFDPSLIPPSVVVFPRTGLLAFDAV